MAQCHVLAISYGESCSSSLIKQSIIHQLAALPLPHGSKSDSDRSSTRPWAWLLALPPRPRAQASGVPGTPLGARRWGADLHAFPSAAARLQGVGLGWEPPAPGRRSGGFPSPREVTASSACDCPLDSERGAPSTRPTVQGFTSTQPHSATPPLAARSPVTRQRRQADPPPDATGRTCLKPKLVGF